MTRLHLLQSTCGAPDWALPGSKNKGWDGGMCSLPALEGSEELVGAGGRSKEWGHDGQEKRQYRER